MSNQKINKGFTLIELLVVIAIVGILAAVVLVSLSSASGKAKRASAIKTVTSLGTELISCLDDSGYPTRPSSNTTGSGRVCSSNTSYNAFATGHSVTWPSLQGDNNTGYCYSTGNSTCTGMTGNNGPLPTTFYLYNTDAPVVTCVYNTTGVYKLQCK